MTVASIKEIPNATTKDRDTTALTAAAVSFLLGPYSPTSWNKNSANFA